MIEIAATAGQSPPPARERVEPAGAPFIRSTPDASASGRSPGAAVVDTRQASSGSDAPERLAAGERSGTRETSRLAEALVRDAIEDRAPRQVDLRLSVDDELGRVIAQVVDGESGEIIRHVPPEEIIEMAKTFRALNGQVVDRRI